MTAKLTADKDFTTSTDRRPAYNSTLPKVAVSCFEGQFYGYINFSASLKVCGGNRHLRQAANRYLPFIMTSENKTYQMTVALDNFLKDNNYFNDHEPETSNRQVLSKWDKDFQTALTTDLKLKYPDIDIDFRESKFELESEDDRGACVFFHRVVFSDNKTLEFVKANIKTLVNFQKTNIYLDSFYSSIDSWTGKSKVLDQVFDSIKTSDKKSGYFHPLLWTEFLK